MKHTDAAIEQRLTRMVRGALRSAIAAHGRLGLPQLDSATKRVVGQLMAEYPVCRCSMPQRAEEEKEETASSRWATSKTGIFPVVAKRRVPFVKY
jgi:hypothetical protein